jgi:hypothetical protein
MKQALLIVNIRAFRHVDIKNKQSHGDGKNTVAERGQAFQTAAGNPVIRGHFYVPQIDAIDTPSRLSRTRSGLHWLN